MASDEDIRSVQLTRKLFRHTAYGGNALEFILRINGCGNWESFFLLALKVTTCPKLNKGNYIIKGWTNPYSLKWFWLHPNSLSYYSCPFLTRFDFFRMSLIPWPISPNPAWLCDLGASADGESWIRWRNLQTAIRRTYDCHSERVNGGRKAQTSKRKGVSIYGA